jgi:hypothetical protein
MKPGLCTISTGLACTILWIQRKLAPMISIYQMCRTPYMARRMVCCETWRHASPRWCSN